MKRILSFILAAFMLLALASCGGKEEADTTAAAQTGEITETESAAQTGEITETESAAQTEPERDAEKDYAEAVRLYDSGDIESAYKLLYTLKGYRDADEYLATIAVLPKKTVKTVTGEGFGYSPENGVYEMTCEPSVDGAGRLVSIKRAGKIQYTGDVDETTNYTYDSEGRLLEKSTVDSSGEESAYRKFTYDGDGRLVREEYFPTKLPGSAGYDEYDYDEAGRVVERRYGGGHLGDQMNSYTYDDAGNCLTVRGWFGEGPVQGFDFEYDGQGRTARQYTYMFDEASKEVVKSGPLEFVYDDDGRVTATGSYNDDGTFEATGEYTYDEEGRLTSRTAGPSDRYEYSYSDDGKTVTTTARFKSGEVYSTTTEEYDGNGVLLKKTFSKEDGRVETTEYTDGFVYAVCYDPTPYYPNGYQAEELAHLN